MTPNETIVHSLKPPCWCNSCLRLTAQADQRRAELDDILRRLDAATEAVDAEGDQ